MADHGALSGMATGTHINISVNSSAKSTESMTLLKSYSTSIWSDECDLGGRQRPAPKYLMAKIRSAEKLMNKSRRVKQVGSGNIYRDDETAVTDEFANELKQKASRFAIYYYDTSTAAGGTCCVQQRHWSRRG